MYYVCMYTLFMYICMHIRAELHANKLFLKYSFNKNHEVPTLFYVIMALVFQHADCLICM
jgi:hypothetical protein